MELNDRKLRILQAVIDEYLGTAEPVGSRAISRKNDLGLSSATIRNEMADLEEMGFLIQPHTSAGRVPSDVAYRYYVNSMMKKYKVGIETIRKLQEELVDKVSRLDKIIKKASFVTSVLTDYTSFVTTPDLKTNLIKKCEVISVSGGCSLLIIVTESGVVRNKIIPVAISESKSIVLSEIINKTLSGRSANEINFDIIDSMKSVMIERLQFTLEVVSEFLNYVYDAIDELDDTEIYMDNTKSILRFNNIEKAEKMFALLEDKKKMKELIDSGEDSRVNIKIGSETGQEEMKDCSLITVNYSLDNKVMGKLGVIGPKRMDYAKVVASLDCISEHIDKILYQMYIGEREG